MVGYVSRTGKLHIDSNRLLLRRRARSGAGILAGFPFRGVLTLFMVKRLAIAAPLVRGYGGCGITLMIVGPGLHPIFF